MRERVLQFAGDTCIGLEDIARKREAGSKYPPPPVGRGLNTYPQRIFPDTGRAVEVIMRRMSILSF